MLGHSACLPGEVGTRPAIRIAGRRQPLIRTRVSIRRPGKVVRGGVATAVQTPASQASIVLPLNYAQVGAGPAIREIYRLSRKTSIARMLGSLSAFTSPLILSL